MPCFHPLPAWRNEHGQILLTKHRDKGTHLQLPCGSCLGCRKAKAKAWALRCHLENQQHAAAIFTTLTYDEQNRPPTLNRSHLQGFLKRLRKKLTTARPIRFFASGEYGEHTNRPHYHAIIYGIAESDAVCIEDTWTVGFTRTTNLTPEAIAYTAGYCSKKIGYKQQITEHVDPETGEVYNWQPPFIQMSRRPGIGGHARQWPESWRLYAIKDGHKMPVPRFLHESWKQQATAEQLEQLDAEKIALTRYITPKQRADAQANAVAQQQLASARRNNYA